MHTLLRKTESPAASGNRVVRWLALWACGAALTLWAAPVKVGGDFPDLSKFELEGKLPENLKGKVVLVDFWASWCGPCRESFPALNALQKKYADRGLVIVGVNVDEKAADMNAFLKKHPADFTIVRDARQKLVAATEAANMPTSFLLDGEGKIRFLHSGFQGEKTRKQYEEQIEGLLKAGATR